MTTATDQQAAPKPAAQPHTLTFGADYSLARAIGNALICASTDPTMPMLCAVRFEWDGTRARIVATDRYRLLIEDVTPADDVDHSGIEPFHFLLGRADAKAALTAIKANKFAQPELVYDGGEAVEFRSYPNSVRYQTVQATFPPYESLIPELGTEKPTDRIAFNPQFLADLGKITTGSARPRRGSNCVPGAVTILNYGTPDKPKATRIDYANGPTLLLMPVRLP